jgi:hypothetical protein
LQDSIQGGPNAPGSVYHYDGNNWTLAATGSTSQLHAIWGSATSDVWITSDDTTTVMHWDGAHWQSVSTGLGGPDSGIGQLAIWGTAANDAWLGGAGAPILHWDGSAWTAPDGAESRSVSALSGAGGTVFVVGPDGSIWSKKR